MFLKENFEFIKNNSLEGCPAALTWLPENSDIWKIYGSRIDCPWKLIGGRRKAWSMCEAVLRHSGTVRSAVFSPDGMHIVSASDDHTARIWNTATGECEAELQGHSSFVTSAVFSPDGMHVVSVADDHTARIWNTATGECRHSLSLSANSQLSIVLPIFGLYIHNRKFYPRLQLSFLDMHGHTIFHTINSQTLNIPPPFCRPTCVSYHLSKICLGYGSGEVLLLQVCMAIILYFTLFLHCSIFFSEISSKIKLVDCS